jgi:ABC-type branched-subunit amino acid transport system substrate-binding protein
VTESKSGGGFPPRIGVIPLTIAVALTAIIAMFGVAPQFQNKTVGVVSSNGSQSSGGSGESNPQATSAAAGTDAGAQGATGSSGSTSGKPGQGAQGAAAGAACNAGQNGGATAPGVTANGIHIASTVVTSGIGAGFLGEAVNGMQAAINEANNAGGICGRRISLDTLNSGWDRTQGGNDISGFINSGKVFSLVGEPDSEGLAGAIENGTIDRAQIPVVGTDGMLKDQYNDQWVWPVAASTVTNMHIIAKYAVSTVGKNAKFGIVYDTRYKFGPEGAQAFDQELFRLTGKHIPGSDSTGSCGGAFCGISSDQQGGYSDNIAAFNRACAPCDVVVMLLEPSPMINWMTGENNCACQWYKHLFGGEPLFDDNFATQCGGACSGMIVWTGYHPDLQPFDSEKAVYTYAHSLSAQCPSCDPHNEFTEGAYLGTRLFIEACEKVGPMLTREALKSALNAETFDLGLSSAPLHYSASLPHLANVAMAAFSDNASGSFNNWSYVSTQPQFIPDPDPGKDLK